MFELKSPKTLEPAPGRRFPALLPPRRPDRHQRRLMAGALILLLGALGLLLYHDRDFWFPETQETEEQPEATAPPIVASTERQPAAQMAAPAVTKKHQRDRKPHSKRPATAAPVETAAAQANPSTLSAPAGSTVTQRTALPPLEVEVVAGDSHRTVRPGTNSVHVELQPGASPQAGSEVAKAAPDTAAAVTTNAAERVQMSTDTAAVVSHSVRPGYPLLARQMKVQGSVILQALISRDGAIQDLHVVSGPPILASAAQEAVKQWRFKPHYLGAEAVETQAMITVNFTISTN